ncbi:MAG: DegQ family serine endoprotease [bacterium]
MSKKRIGIGLISIIGIGLISALIGAIIASNLNLTGSTEAVKGAISESQQVTPSSGIISFNTFVEIAKKANPSVVYISTTQVIKGIEKFHDPSMRNPFRDFFGDDLFEKFFEFPKQHKQSSLGSGFIIDEEGYILTNYHVVKDADDIKVTTSTENEYEAKVIGSDEDMDIALLKIKAKENLPIVEMGDSDALQIGEWVVAIGNPFGLEHTVTAGIVSAKWRPIGQGPYNSFIQTDASINPGNSGGPLLNIEGKVVGINTAIIMGGDGIGFAIPINMVQSVLSDLKEEGKIRRGWLGLMIQKVTPDIASSFDIKENKGALVAEVEEDSPADKVDIKRGDIITKFNNKEIKEYTDLSRYAGLTKPGTSVELEFIRDGKRKTVKVKLGEFPKEGTRSKTSSTQEQLFGMTVQDITPELAAHFNFSETEGVMVNDVESGSNADEAGIKRGDVILEVNREKTSSVKEFRKAIKSGKSKDTVLFLIGRDDRIIFIAVKK